MLDIFKKLKSLSFDLKSNLSGNVAIIFAVCSVPLMIAVGVAIDLSRISQAQSKLQDVADATVLQSASLHLGSKKYKKREAQSEGDTFFRSQIAETVPVKVDSVKVEKVSDTVMRVRSEGKLNAVFPQILGYPEYNISVVSEASVAKSIGAEIIFAVDTTNSMSFDSRWSTSIGAIEELLGQIKSSSEDDNFYIGLVPFQDRVNLGLDTPRSWTRGSIPNTASPNDWRGCLEPREKPTAHFPWALDDEKPQSGKFEYSTRHLEGGMGEFKHQGIRCPDDVVVKPTADIDEVIDAARSLHSDGTGRLDVGLAWAWRMLSPKWKGQWDEKDYPAADTSIRKKYIVFLTDGNSTAYKYEMSKEEDLGNNNMSTVGLEHLVDLCTRIKAEDIQIYMLDIGGNSHAAPYFKDCASSADKYILTSSPDDLVGVFDNILSQHNTDLRLIR